MQFPLWFPVGFTEEVAKKVANSSYDEFFYIMRENAKTTSIFSKYVHFSTNELNEIQKFAKENDIDYDEAEVFSLGFLSDCIFKWCKKNTHN